MGTRDPLLSSTAWELDGQFTELSQYPAYYTTFNKRCSVTKLQFQYTHIHVKKCTMLKYFYFRHSVNYKEVACYNVSSKTKSVFSSSNSAKSLVKPFALTSSLIHLEKIYLKVKVNSPNCTTLINFHRKEIKPKVLFFNVGVNVNSFILCH